MNTIGVFDQGVKEWVQHMYQVMLDNGMAPEAAQHKVETMADSAFGFWRVGR